MQKAQGRRKWLNTTNEIVDISELSYGLVLRRKLHDIFLLCLFFSFMYFGYVVLQVMNNLETWPCYVFWLWCTLSYVFWILSYPNFTPSHSFIKNICSSSIKVDIQSTFNFLKLKIYLIAFHAFSSHRASF